MEINTGIDFPGESLEYSKNVKLDEADISGHDVIVCEVAAPEDKQFIFKFEKNVQIFFGKCEYCYSTRALRSECACKKVRYCNDECRKRDERFHLDKCDAVAEMEENMEFTQTPNSRLGLVGLGNIGNTCFMNSALQCLSNTYALTKYFLEGNYKEELNKENALGMKGQLATAYAKLMNELWYGSQSSFSPWSLKKVVGKFQPMFSGFAQHDSQELLSFVLDGLHEDLSRITKKPYVELPDNTDSMSDKELSQLCW